jgi:hypothetical protein
MRRVASKCDGRQACDEAKGCSFGKERNNASAAGATAEGGLRRMRAARLPPNPADHDPYMPNNLNR